MRLTQVRALPLAIAAFVMGAALVSFTAMATMAWAHSDLGIMGGMRDHMRAMHGGGTDASGAPVSVGDSSEDVAIRDFAFSPGNLQVPIGATVTWTNDDGAPHDATARDGSWKSGTLKKGQSETLTFTRAGDFEYYCTIHPGMVARLTVQ